MNSGFQQAQHSTLQPQYGQPQSEYGLPPPQYGSLPPQYGLPPPQYGQQSPYHGYQAQQQPQPSSGQYTMPVEQPMPPQTSRSSVTAGVSPFQPSTPVQSSSQQSNPLDARSIQRSSGYASILNEQRSPGGVALSPLVGRDLLHPQGTQPFSADQRSLIEA
ncbi:hypothetical protein LTR99_011149 [Exophiala xenobiotica]|uniref:Uncharacterized protein n=1 Tax=Vermiconidia calcicola TaxID=1690605 RepID=A0AAV9PS08_9PEZI|nr:hypothetical protein LTR99_011149 [Exophiala xenobiotica]KAK5399963.1 hypothetical protein LTR06_011379 [Exophiala xenobiotica]KAK5425386.1 hypothetical protein LTR34_011162 [Exophiala xenobiotica]KAK5527500.1 hypothetical protein LTR25_011132 [Vermiconidia calcicola]KAK5528342.1 hypothetical protein LTR23_011045 [Chaetothyriales sp. CCFEE 6169]